VSRPLVSVLVTLYNRERYVAAAIESVLAQSLQDFEIVVTDDMSTDGSAAVVAALAARDSRIRLHRNPRNLGDYANRNHAASLARGTYLKFHDSDDVMYPHCLETMVTLLAREPSAVLALSNGGYWPGGPVPILSTPSMSYRREFLGHGLFMAGPAGALFRRDAFEASGGFEDHGPASDYLYWMRVCARHDVVLVPGDLFWYRVHDGQSLTAPSSLASYARVPAHVWATLADTGCPLTSEEREVARRNLVFSVAKQVWRAARRGRLRDAACWVRESGFGPAVWLAYLRPPRRSLLAGVPLDSAGDYLVSDWCRPAEDTPVSEPRTGTDLA
jgi:hypothetical protein